MTRTLTEHLSDQRAIDVELAALRAMHAEPRTRYGIKMTPAFLHGATEEIFVGDHLHWTNKQEHVKRFDSMTAANAFAVIDLELTLDDFTVEAI